MILHEISSSCWNRPVFSWWAVDSTSLTLARCAIRNRYRLRVGIVPPDVTVPIVASYQGAPKLGDAAIALLFGCRLRFKQLAGAAGLLAAAGDDVSIPEYILLGDSRIPYAIMHTVDPVFIASYIDGRVARSMGNLLAFRSNVHLPPSGWEYWTTDAYQEFERMSLEYAERQIPFLDCR